MIDLIIDALAAYRLTRLVTTDTFPPALALRERIVNAHEVDGEPDSIAELVQCPWCSGAYISLAVVLMRARFPGPWGIIAKAAATSAVVGLISTHWDD